MVHILSLTPAYGRSYKTVDALKQAFVEGKDFRVAPSGPYCSIRDEELREYDAVQLLQVYPTVISITLMRSEIPCQP